MGRKWHNGEAGYIAERMNPYVADTKVVIYVAAEQGFDPARGKYAVVCKAHATVRQMTNVPKAREYMKEPDRFCLDCERLADSGVEPVKSKTSWPKAKCYCGCGKPVKKGDFFATNRCGREYAEELIKGNEQRWCQFCQAWKGYDRYGKGEDFCEECGNRFPEVG